MRASVIAMAIACFPCMLCRAQNSVSVAEVSARIRYVTAADTNTKSHASARTRETAARDSSHRTVIWLQPAEAAHLPPARPGTYIMKQQGKEFHPHLMIVAAGSTVSFPNADPFFHNVFSLFNGRRFDLGLYQSGQTREIAFNRVGVSYIFCNIHPEMSAVIVSLNTHYFAIADANYQVSLRDIPEGDYTLQVWSESSSPEALRSLTRRITITKANPNLGEIVVPISSHNLADHLNKFGAPYDTHAPQAPY